MIPFRRRVAAGLLGLAGCMPAIVAGADPGDLGAACQLDYQLFCEEDVAPESAREAVVACLERHVDSLTESCRAALDPSLVPVPPRVGALGRACREDFRRTCGRAADRVAFARCIRIHRESFSPACRDALDAELD